MRGVCAKSVGPEAGTIARFTVMDRCYFISLPAQTAIYRALTRQAVTGDEIWFSLPSQIKYLSFSMPPLCVFSH